RVDERERPVADGEDHERPREDASATVTVDERSRDGTGNDAHESVRPDHEPRRTQSDAPDVVEVDQEERDQHAVPEGADEPAYLQRLDGAGEPWIETAQEPEHGRTVALAPTAHRPAAEPKCANSVPIGRRPFRLKWQRAIRKEVHFPIGALMHRALAVLLF